MVARKIAPQSALEARIRRKIGAVRARLLSRKPMLRVPRPLGALKLNFLGKVRALGTNVRPNPSLRLRCWSCFSGLPHRRRSGGFPATRPGACLGQPYEGGSS